MGRSRGRLSASALTTYLRCPRQWLLTYQAGLSGPKRPSQILGVVLEEAVCALMMHHPPPEVVGPEGLRQWAQPLVDELATKAWEDGRKAWGASLWKAEKASWDDVTVASLVERINGGLDLFLEEVKACFDQNGGPFLETHRSGKSPFSVPSPSWGRAPVFPLPEKLPDAALRRWSADSSPAWQAQDERCRWNEAWECARPWFKDPRVHQPQRLYHPDGWASGELDLVLRWDGQIRIVDIKSGRSSSPFASSLEHQLRFYAWLWHQTHEGEVAQGMEGWYLADSERVIYSPPTADEMSGLTTSFRATHEAMQNAAEGVLAFPGTELEACTGEQAGCGWCAVSQSESGTWVGPDFSKWIASATQGSLSSPYQNLVSIQGRVSVRGRLTGAWGPMSNHFGEPVLGALLVVGDQHITVEESEPGAFQGLHNFVDQDVVLSNALPGVWRDQARLYLDQRSSAFSEGDLSQETGPFTRLGLLRTRANVAGRVLSLGQRSGVRIDGKPWSMLSLILWDGSHIAEVVAFGQSISQRLLALQPGDAVAMTGVELGWRGGILQLRIDNRKTRIETPRSA
jgi:hypothetical protein